MASATRWRVELEDISGRGPESSQALARFQSDRTRRLRLELVRQTQRRLGAARVEAAEAPRLEDRRRVPVWLDEVTLAQVHDEVVPHDVVDGPERFHVPRVHRVDRGAKDGDDRAAAVEREGGEREDALPVADLVAERELRGSVARREVEAADETRAGHAAAVGRELCDVLAALDHAVRQLHATLGVVHEV